MKGSCEYADSRQGVVIQLGGWAGAKTPNKNSRLRNVNIWYGDPTLVRACL